VTPPPTPAAVPTMDGATTTGTAAPVDVARHVTGTAATIAHVPSWRDGYGVSVAPMVPPAPATGEATAGDLRAALALIDRVAVPGVAWCDEATFAAVFAFARAEIARSEANERYCERSKAGMSDGERNAIDAECEAAEPVAEAALAALVALARTVVDGAS